MEWVLLIVLQSGAYLADYRPSNSSSSIQSTKFGSYAACMRASRSVKYYTTVGSMKFRLSSVCVPYDTPEVSTPIVDKLLGVGE